MSQTISQPNSIILAGSNSRRLAYSIGNTFNLPVLQHKITHFVNSEMKITIPFRLDSDTQVWLVQSTSNPANDNLMELMLLVDTLKLEGITDINVIIPYFGYSRQDKRHLAGECLSMRMITNILQNLGVKQILTCDIHNPVVLEGLNLKVTNQTTLGVMAKNIYKDLKLNIETEKDFIIASPDQGGIFRCEDFAKNFYTDQTNIKTVSVTKERELTTVHFSHAVELHGDIDRPNLIIIDDVSTSGRTILNAIELCKSNKVSEVYVVIVHADFAKGVLEKFENHDLIKKVYTSNTIEKPVEDLDWFGKVKVIDIAPSLILK
jgi:ribose-phosphate pyrophosphokinase